MVPANLKKLLLGEASEDLKRRLNIREADFLPWLSCRKREKLQLFGKCDMWFGLLNAVSKSFFFSRTV